MQRSRDMKTLGNLRFSLKTNFGIFSARSEIMYAFLVTSKKFYWFGFIFKGIYRGIYGWKAGCINYIVASYSRGHMPRCALLQTECLSSQGDCLA